MTDHLDPPGPKGHRLLGAGPELRRQGLLRFFLNLAADHGDLSHFRIGPFHVYFANHPDLVRELLVNQAANTRKSREVRQMRMVMGNGLVTNEGESWRRQRRAIQPAFHQERIRRYGQVMVGRAVAHFDQWRESRELDMHQELMRLTLGIVADTLLGVNVKGEADRVGHFLSVFQTQYEAMMRRPVPIPLSFPTPGNLRAQAAARRLQRDVVAQIRSRVTGDGEDLLSWLVSARGETGMSETQIRDEAVTLLLAGHETTANALTWATWMLARNPAAEAALREEVDAVLAGARPMVDDLSKLRYTRAVVDEALRLYPPVWATSRDVVEPFELGGYTLRKGANVLVSPYVMHRDSRFYDDPESFRPERWLDPDTVPPKYAYFPFGGGPRFCIGSTFALTEAVLLLACLVQRFRWELDPGHPVEIQPSVTLRPRTGIRMRMRGVRPQVGGLGRAMGQTP